ncbi:MAG: cytochrome c biogenesis protein CcdA [Planctomycetota bacterium]
MPVKVPTSSDPRRRCGFPQRVWGWLAVCVAWAGVAAGQPGGGGGGFGFGFGAADEAPEPVTAEAVFMSDRVHVGSPTAVAVVIDIAEGFHINPDAARSGPEWFPGQYPTALRAIDVPEGVRLGEPQFPEPHPYQTEYAPQPLDVYEGRAVLTVPVLLDAGVEPGALTLSFELEVQACDDQVCFIPETKALSATIEVVPVGTAIEAVDAEREDVFAEFDPAGWSRVGESLSSGDATPPEEDAAAAAAGGEIPGAGDRTLWLTLLAALGGGLLLNFTPCVLPVVPLKVMSLAQHGDGAGGQKRTVLLALVMSAGIVGFWLAIAAAIVGLQQFQAVNQLFQYPAFNLAVGGVIAVLAVSMLGVFTINLPRAVYQVNPTGDTVTGSLAFGVMTAVLATPCAGPFMGSAMAWATLQSPATVLAVFAAIGVGMALPYLALTLMPGLIEKLPRAGAGSELLKQTMGVLMLAAAAYFVGVGIVALTSDGTAANSQAYWWAVGACVAAAGGGCCGGGWARWRSRSGRGGSWRCAGCCWWGRGRGWA